MIAFVNVSSKVSRKAITNKVNHLSAFIFIQREQIPVVSLHGSFEMNRAFRVQSAPFHRMGILSYALSSTGGWFRIKG